MLAEVNLLQKHEKNNKVFYWLLVIIVVLILALAGGTYYYSSILKDEIEDKQHTLDVTEATLAKLKADMNTSGYADLQNLQESVEALKKHPIDVDALVNRFSMLLPSNGYFQTFEYTGENIILQVLLADDLDASYYLHHLSQQDWITSVNLLSVTSSSEEDTTESPSYTAQYEIAVNQELLRGEEEGDSE